jgi:cysteine desulfurase / selenocysteine lyase
MFSPVVVRQDFPILHQEVNGYPLVYFDNAATTQKPKQVLDAINHYYAQDNANVHRGVHALSERATAAFEAARRAVQQWINAPLAEECIFVRGTTEAINLVAQSYALPRLQRGDEVIVTYLEHHSNIVPWQMVCERTGAQLRVVNLLPDGQLDMEHYEQLLSKKTKLVALTYASNALGTINPVRAFIDKAHAVGAVVLLDGAQATAHLPIDINALNCDFYAFSAHKMYGPTGIGILWGRASLLEEMPPYQGGGEMIRYVTFEHTEYAGLPHKFEAGTPHIEGAIGLKAAIEYLSSFHIDDLMTYESKLLAYATQSILSLPGFQVHGLAPQKVPVISFTHATIHAHDLATILDSRGVAMRSGHHCAMPLMKFLKLSATTRLSLSFYNTVEEIDASIDALRYACEVFG